MRIFSFALAMLLFAAGCSTKAPPPPGPSPEPAETQQPIVVPQPTPPTEATWERFYPPDGQYSVCFPVLPEAVPSEKPDIKQYGLNWTNGRVFLSSESEPADASQEMAAAKDAVVGKNELLFDWDISVDRYAGRSFAFIDADDDVVEIRLVVRGKTFFQLIALAPKAAYVEDDPDTARFFDSFRFEAPEGQADGERFSDTDGRQ